jgi:hypothetical protein
VQANAITGSKLADGAVDATKVQPGAFVEPCGQGSVVAAGKWFVPNLPTDGTFVPPTRFGGEWGFACEGSGLTATKTGVGRYRLRTNGIPSFGLIQAVNIELPAAAGLFASSDGPFAGDLFDVFVHDAAGAAADAWYFSLVLFQTQ